MLSSSCHCVLFAKGSHWLGIVHMTYLCRSQTREDIRSLFLLAFSCRRFFHGCHRCSAYQSGVWATWSWVKTAPFWCCLRCCTNTCNFHRGISVAYPVKDNKNRHLEIPCEIFLNCKQKEIWFSRWYYFQQKKNSSQWIEMDWNKFS